MQNNNFLSRDRTQALIDSIGVKQADGQAFLDGLAKQGYIIEGYNDKPVQTEQTLGDKLKKRGSNVVSDIKEQANNLSNTNNPLEAIKAVGRGVLRPVGDIAGAGVDIVNAGLTAADNLTGNIVSSGAKAGLTAILNTSKGQEGLANAEQSLDKYNEWKMANPDVAKDLEAVVNIANIIPVGKAVGSVAGGVARKTISTVPKVAEATTKTAKKGANIVQEGISPTPTFEKALGEASLAKEKQLPRFSKAVSAIDIKDVKTFSDLNKKFSDAIPDLAKKVDVELSKDPKEYTIDSLLIPQKTKAGKEIKVDYISRSFEGLKDLYTKLGDDVSKADIIDLENKAKTVGLTRKEVNDLARIYNDEYGSKAFTATGDIKTGFNAEIYESTRKGLKEIARSGLGGKEAQALDDTLSSIYDAKKLTERNMNAANALKQRIEEKGWIGKGIRGAFEVSDLITGGAVRALRDTVLARGNAQKVQNYLELENKLQRNLQVISKAMKAKTEKEATYILNSLSPTPKKKVVSTLEQEAKKYKSAEEFVKAQGTPVYHGTKSNIDIKDLSAQTESRGQYLGNGIYFTKYKEGADFYGGKTLSAIVNEKDFLNISNLKGIERTNKIGSFGTYKQYLKNSNLDDTLANFKKWQKNQQEVADKILNMGYKGVTDGQQHVIFDKSAIKTKSQLEDIWKQAQGKLPKEQK